MMSTVKASADKLAKHRCIKQACDLSTVGYKEHTPEAGNWLQVKRLKNLREAHAEIVSELRVANTKHIATGILKPELGLVLLEGSIGPHWRYFGFTDSKVKYLYPEEALYLVESSCLEIYYSQLPVSNEQIYSWVISQIRFEEFLTYGHLTRLGYVVRRYEGESDITEYERKLQLDQHVLKKRKKFTKGKTEKKMKMSTSVENDTGKPTEVNFSKLRLTQDGSNSHKFESSNSPNLKSIAGLCSETLISKTEPDLSVVDTAMNSEDLCYSRVETVLEFVKDEHSEDPAWHIYKHTMRNIIEYLDNELYSFQLCTTNEKLIPAWPSKQPLVAEHDRAFGCHSGDMAVKIGKAQNWREYKEILLSIENSESPTAYLWDDEVQPLLRPSSLSSITSIYDRLQIIDSIPDCIFYDEPSYSISYNVYTPAQKSTFKKSGFQLPAYRIIVMKDGSSPPALSDVVKIQSGDGVPLLWTVSDNGDVQFYSFRHVIIAEYDNSGR